MEFYKYQGTGNDFVVLEALDGRPAWLDSATVQAVCDRHFGVGADGILLIERGIEADWFMRVLNADGSEAEMCGNGIRCVAKHLATHLMKDQVIPVETWLCKGIIDRDDDDVVESVTVCWVRQFWNPVSPGSCRTQLGHCSFG